MNCGIIRQPVVYAAASGSPRGPASFGLGLRLPEPRLDRIPRPLLEPLRRHRSVQPYEAPGLTRRKREILRPHPMVEFERLPIQPVRGTRGALAPRDPGRRIQV